MFVGVTSTSVKGAKNDFPSELLSVSEISRNRVWTQQAATEGNASRTVL